MEDHANGEVDLSQGFLSALKKLPVVVLEEEDRDKREHLARVFQGVRHVSGIRAWGPYQQAQIVAMMLNEGRDQTEICEILGLPTRRINILRRSFYALTQMREDSDFGDEAKPGLFSAFDEIFKVPEVRNWLEWSDDQNAFLNEDRRKLLYAWLVGMEDANGNRQPAKIVDSKEIRKLKQLMADPVQFKRFCESSSLRVDEALEGAVAPKNEIPWRTYLAQILNILHQVPAVDLEGAAAEDEALLTRARGISAVVTLR